MVANNEPRNHDERELLAHLEAEEARVKAWVAEDPQNRFAAYSVVDLDHWREYGVTSVAAYTKYNLVADIVDAHKEAYGFKPNWAHLMSLSIAELEDEDRKISAQLQDVLEREEIIQAENAAEFERRITDAMAMGAEDRYTAMRWIFQADCQDEIDRPDGFLTGDFAQWHFNLPERYIAEIDSIYAAHEVAA